MPLKTSEEEIREATVSLADAKRFSVGAAGAAVSSEQDGLFTLLKEQRRDTGEAGFCRLAQMAAIKILLSALNSIDRRFFPGLLGQS